MRDSFLENNPELINPVSVTVSDSLGVPVNTDGIVAQTGSEIQTDGADRRAGCTLAASQVAHAEEDHVQSAKNAGTDIEKTGGADMRAGCAHSVSVVAHAEANVQSTKNPGTHIKETVEANVEAEIPHAAPRPNWSSSSSPQLLLSPRRGCTAARSSCAESAAVPSPDAVVAALESPLPSGNDSLTSLPCIEDQSRKSSRKEDSFRLNTSRNNIPAAVPTPLFGNGVSGHGSKHVAAAQGDDERLTDRCRRSSGDVVVSSNSEPTIADSSRCNKDSFTKVVDMNSLPINNETAISKSDKDVVRNYNLNSVKSLDSCSKGSSRQRVKQLTAKVRREKANEDGACLLTTPVVAQCSVGAVAGSSISSATKSSKGISSSSISRSEDNGVSVKGKSNRDHKISSSLKSGKDDSVRASKISKGCSVRNTKRSSCTASEDTSFRTSKSSTGSSGASKDTSFRTSKSSSSIPVADKDSSLRTSKSSNSSTISESKSCSNICKSKQGGGGECQSSGLNSSSNSKCVANISQPASLGSKTSQQRLRGIESKLKWLAEARGGLSAAILDPVQGPALQLDVLQKEATFLTHLLESMFVNGLAAQSGRANKLTSTTHQVTG